MYLTCAVRTSPKANDLQKACLQRESIHGETCAESTCKANVEAGTCAELKSHTFEWTTQIALLRRGEYKDTLAKTVDAACKVNVAQRARTLGTRALITTWINLRTACSTRKTLTVTIKLAQFAYLRREVSAPNAFCALLSASGDAQRVATYV